MNIESDFQFHTNLAIEGLSGARKSLEKIATQLEVLQNELKAVNSAPRSAKEIEAEYLANLVDRCAAFETRAPEHFAKASRDGARYEPDILWNYERDELDMDGVAFFLRPQLETFIKAKAKALPAGITQKERDSQRTAILSQMDELETARKEMILKLSELQQSVSV